MGPRLNSRGIISALVQESLRLGTASMGPRLNSRGIGPSEVQWVADTLLQWGRG